MSLDSAIETTIENNVDFILSHFQDQVHLFPRKIMISDRGQLSILNKQEVLAKYKQANYKDCKINAYPEFVQWKGINRVPPSFLFIDLDLENFNYDKILLDKALCKAQKKTMDKIKGHPTILWSGGGYHIYQPIKFIISKESKEQGYSETLESIERFSKFLPILNNDLTTEFIRFAEAFLTNNKNDSKHKPSINSCLIRIPGTINSKYESKVKIIQKWDGVFSPINYILKDFEIYLIQRKINNKINAKYNHLKSRNQAMRYGEYRNKSISWIEKLLETPIEDHRHYCLWRVLGPYLLNIKRMSESKSAQAIEEWLTKCNNMRKLDFRLRSKIYSVIKGNKGFGPISHANLKEENRDLYLLLKSKGVFYTRHDSNNNSYSL